MAKSRSLQQAVRFALATAATAAAGVTALHAQEAPAPAAAAAPVEEVVVTGSRLSTPNETSISPITSVSAVDLQQTGLTRVEDVLNNLPMVFAGMNATTANGADGTATVDLRGLGNQRTLVLVDGLRLGPGSPSLGRNYSDINQIPAAMVERVDVLTGGASAVYGADAVAGVVNFIMKTHFEGVQVDAGYNFYQHNNNNSTGVGTIVAASGFPVPSGNVDSGFGKYGSILVGSNFADNKGNATAYITYNNQGSALQSQYDYSACSLGVTTLTSGSKALTCAGSSTAAKNGAGGDIRVPNAAGHLVGYTVDGTNNTFRPFTGSDLYNFGPLNYYLNPSERWTAGSFVNYDINSHVNLYTSIMFMRNTVNAQIAPSGAFSVLPAFVACKNPLLNASELSVICPGGLPAPGGASSETYTDPITGVTTTFPGENIGLGRRNVEGGNRTFEARNTSNREVIGLKGDFGGDVWTYNVYAQHGNVDIANSNANYTSNSAVQQAINVLPVGANGAPACGGPTSPSFPLVSPGTGYAVNQNCVPWNIWKANGVTPQSLAFISLPLTEQGTTQEYVVDGSVTGDLGKYGIKLPTADQGMQFNIGAEWRQENTEFLPDAEEQAGNGGGVGGPTPPISGGFTVREVFTEIRLPLAEHVAFADDLTVEGGYRYSKYSEGFDTNTFKLGLEWAPIRDIRLRGSYQRAVRAPNIGELFTPNTVGLDGSTDPCAAPLKNPAGSTTGPLANGTTYQQCLAAGVKPNVSATNAGLNQYGNIAPNPSPQYNGLLGGNPNLQPETSDTYTVGVVLQPRFLSNLTLSVDYYNITITNTIGPLGGNTILLNCLATLQASFCNNVHRDQFGSLWLTPNGFVTDPAVNAGKLSTRGIDVKASYRQPMSGLGSLLFSLEGNWTQNLTTTPIPGFGSYDCVGFFGATCGASNPSWRHVFNTTWSTPWDGLDINLRWRYIGANKSEQTSNNTFLAGTSFVVQRIPAYNYIDLTGTFNIYKNVRMELGVNNIADKSPPIIGGADCSTSSPSGANCNGNTFPGVYDAMGRYLFATITATF